MVITGEYFLIVLHSCLVPVVVRRVIDHRVVRCPNLDKDKSESVVATAEKPLLPKGYCYRPLGLGVDENGNYWEKLSDSTAFMVCTLCGKEGDHRLG